MKCPNCGFNFFEGCHCPDCGVDVYVFRKTRSASIRLYNDALKMAEERDLSGAASNLEQSLLFDKNNVSARNLLGLIQKAYTFRRHIEFLIVVSSLVFLCKADLLVSNGLNPD